MALPSNVGNGTVTGTFIDNAGIQITGSVTFTPTAARLLNPTAVPSPVTILPKPVKVDLVEGSFSQALVATDDTDLNPIGWNYRVDFLFTGAKPASFFIDVPEGTTVDLAVVSPVGQGNGTQIIRGSGVPEYVGEADGSLLVLVDGEPTWGISSGGGGTDLTSYAQVSGLGDYPDSFPSTVADVTGLTAALAGKQASGSYAAATHTHAQGDVTGLVSDLAGKAATSHTHAIADVTALQTALDGKQAAGSYAASTHTHAQSDVTGLSTALSGKAATTHTHTASQVSDSTTVGRNVLTAADAAAARAAIGAGTSSLAIGTTSTTAKAGDYAPDLSSYATTASVTSGLAGKANTSHTHAATDTTTGTFDAARIPTLAQSKVTGLEDDLAERPTSTTVTAIEVVDTLPDPGVAGTVYLLRTPA